MELGEGVGVGGRLILIASVSVTWTLAERKVVRNLVGVGSAEEARMVTGSCGVAIFAEVSGWFCRPRLSFDVENHFEFEEDGSSNCGSGDSRDRTLSEGDYVVYERM